MPGLYLCFLFFLLLKWSCCVCTWCAEAGSSQPRNHHSFCFFWVPLLDVVVVVLLLLLLFLLLDLCSCSSCYCCSYSCWCLLLLISALPFDSAVFVNYVFEKNTKDKRCSTINKTTKPNVRLRKHRQDRTHKAKATNARSPKVTKAAKVTKAKQAAAKAAKTTT